MKHSLSIAVALAVIGGPAASPQADGSIQARKPWQPHPLCGAAAPRGPGRK